MPPYIVNGASMLGTGQFPKFQDDAYKVTAGQGDDADWYVCGGDFVHRPAAVHQQLSDETAEKGTRAL